jgi:hypothetical protein
MTRAEQDANGLGSYIAGVEALRLSALMRGEVLPIEGERVDLLVMAAIARGEGRRVSPSVHSL